MSLMLVLCVSALCLLQRWFFHQAVLGCLLASLCQFSLFSALALQRWIFHQAVGCLLSWAFLISLCSLLCACYSLDLTRLTSGVLSGIFSFLSVLCFALACYSAGSLLSPGCSWGVCSHEQMSVLSVFFSALRFLQRWIFLTRLFRCLLS
jgi:hypothetical protein